MLGSEVTRRHGGGGLPDGTISLTFRGSAGQSFGAFVPRGITMTLVGDANDYLGKGLSGGILVVRPPEASPFTRRGADHRRQRRALRGDVGRRRSSGARSASGSACATPVPPPSSKGVGDHACEYMTGGTVLVLGPTGRNFAAGMSGGDRLRARPRRRCCRRRLNPEMVELEPLDEEDRRTVEELCSRHVAFTGSRRSAARLLGRWEETLAEIVKVMPRDYRRVLEATRRAVEAGGSVDDEIMAAAHG